MTLEEIMQTEWGQRSPEELNSMGVLEQQKLANENRMRNAMSNIDFGVIRQEPSIADRALGVARRMFWGENDPRKTSLLNQGVLLPDGSRGIPMKGAPAKYAGVADAFGGPLIFRAVTPTKFMKATAEGASDLTMDQLPLKTLQKAHRSKEGGLYQGSAKDRGNYAIIPGKEANELTTVYMPEKERGKGYAKKLLRDATQRNLRASTKPLDLYAFKDPPKEGMPSLGKIYEKAGFDEVDQYPYDPAQNTNLDRWIEQGFKPVPVGHYRYMQKFDKDPALSEGARKRSSILLDMEGLDDLDRYPKVLDRLSPTEFYKPRGKPSADLANALTEENAKRLVTIGQQGIKEGGVGWYNTRPIYDEFVNVHGQAEGTKKFLEWADVNKVFSPIASPENQLKRASFAQYTQKQGKDPTTLANAKAFAAHRFPPGLGSIGHKIHMAKLRDVIEGKDLRYGDLKRGQKIIPYGESMKGNFHDFTADRHIKNITTSIDPSLSPSNRVTMKANEFFPLSRFYKEQVSPELGLPMAQTQSSVWVGGKDITGVSDTRSLAETLQDLLLDNAQAQHLTPQEAKKRYFNQDLILY